MCLHPVTAVNALWIAQMEHNSLALPPLRLAHPRHHSKLCSQSCNHVVSFRTQGFLGFLRGWSLRVRAIRALAPPPKPWGLNGRSLAGFLSCTGDSCFFSYRSSEYNKAEAEISLFPLVSCQFPSQL